MTNNREIIADNLVKRYGDFIAVDNVSFKVEDGEIYGFLGPNGAGKSTTVTMLTTLSVPTSGHATVGGYDIALQAAQVRRIAGVALQDIGLDPIMKSMELLTIQAQLFGLSKRDAVKRANELLEIVGLSQFTDRRVGKYSGGMRRRLDLAMALVHQPQILFLDEPTTGLDPASRRDIWTEVRRLNREYDMTIFLTTQYLEEADELADRIAIMNKGKIAVEGQPATLKAALGRESVNITLRDNDIAERASSVLADMFDKVQVDRRTVRLYRQNAAQVVPAVVNRLTEGGIETVSLTLTQPTLDDVFLQVTGQTLEEAVAPVEGETLPA
ncbi:MAG: ATP-binding cassette domain-containing protein [Anaerolineae bacterium]|jgi:ABC-2 type transport system ATP-binding protein|nr:ATP-binding cassette domain-containing protein [Anaerolineae bacterium]